MTTEIDPAETPGWRDDVLGSLFAAGLALDCLADRLTHPDDSRALEDAVQHLDAAVRDLRLMLRAIDDGLA